MKSEASETCGAVQRWQSFDNGGGGRSSGRVAHEAEGQLDPRAGQWGGRRAATGSRASSCSLSGSSGRRAAGWPAAAAAPAGFRGALGLASSPAAPRCLPAFQRIFGWLPASHLLHTSPAQQPPHLLADLLDVGQADQAGVGHLRRRHVLVARVPRRQADAAARGGGVEAVGMRWAHVIRCREQHRAAGWLCIPPQPARTCAAALTGRTPRRPPTAAASPTAG